MTLRRRTIVALWIAVTVLASTGAAAAATFGALSGPSTVRTGKLVTFAAKGLLPKRRISVVITPLAYVGGNCCGVAVHGLWRTNSSGHVQLRFHFPARYYTGCTGVGCTGHPKFRRGSRAQVGACVQGPVADGTPPQAECAVKTVIVR